MKPGEAKSTVLEGVFLPTSWAAGGEVVDISLMTFDEKDYSIDSAVARDHGLLELIRRRVRLSAVVRRGRVIAVTHIEIINEEPHPMGGASDERTQRDGEI
ncbi:MAG: hypothetical protein JRG86_00210 [Deltaproteobacteria bacterium]|nr:hypothetical protein [Deltaproteobacteria bacterium]